MARRTASGKTQVRKRDWRTTMWYVIGVLIVLTMVFSLFAAAFSQ